MDIGCLPVAVALAPQHRRHRQGSPLWGCSQARAQPFMRNARRKRREPCLRRWNSVANKSLKKDGGPPLGTRRPETNEAPLERREVAPICRAVASKVGGSSCIDDGSARDVTAFWAGSRDTKVLHWLPRAVVSRWAE